MTNVEADPILQRFRAQLDKLYGPRLERVVLFGSRARGDAKQDSDYDIAVFLTELRDRWEELDRLAEVETDFLAATGALVHCMPYKTDDWHARSPMMSEIRRDGLEL
jgi:uncharacterized protein